MLVLDTDHLTEYQRGTSAEAQRLKSRLDQATEPYATTIVTVEEIMRGWMAAIRRNQDPYRQINAYTRLQRLFRFFATWNVLEWDESAADRYDSLRIAKVRMLCLSWTLSVIDMLEFGTTSARERYVQMKAIHARAEGGDRASALHREDAGLGNSFAGRGRRVFNCRCRLNPTRVCSSRGGPCS